ncbi:MAG: hypothetical protein AB7N91_13540 [Candidatus Tectimicrobiota bacterium]
MCDLEEHGRAQRWGAGVMGVTLVYLLLVVSGWVAGAQDFGHPKYGWQERKNPDRWEGVKPLDISGEKIDLVAVLLTPATSATGLKLDGAYHLGLYLPQAEPHIDISVRDYRKFHNNYRYHMRLQRRKYASDFQQLSWDATILRELPIAFADLGAVAAVHGQSYPVVAPLLLSTTPLVLPLRLQGCRFVFLPSDTMRVQYSLYAREDTPRPFLKGDVQWEKEQRQSITWDGRDHQGRPAPAGWYGVTVHGIIERPGQPPDSLPALDWFFYYTSEIRS